MGEIGQACPVQLGQRPLQEVRINNNQKSLSIQQLGISKLTQLQAIQEQNGRVAHISAKTQKGSKVGPAALLSIACMRHLHKPSQPKP